MKLKNNDPGKIWAKSDKRFKSYDQKVVTTRFIIQIFPPSAFVFVHVFAQIIVCFA